MSEQLKQTALHALHLEFGGIMVEFAGWELPFQYPEGSIAEHNQCRKKAALFDISHLGQVELHGLNCAEKLESLVPSNLKNLAPGQARYTFFTNESGRIMDDLIVSNTGDHLFVVVNASMRDQDIGHMRKNLEDIDVQEVLNRSLIALQGPSAAKVLATHFKAAVNLKFMQTTIANIQGIECRVSRMGFTGEDGFEISIPQEAAIYITKLLLAHEDCKLAGLAARETLRLEAGLCLYGNDIDDSTTPVEASLDWAIPRKRREEGGFFGSQQILNEIENGARRKLIGIRPEGKTSARIGVEIVSLEGNKIGVITSGGYGPTVLGPVAMGYVAIDHAQPGNRVELIIRGKRRPAIVCSLPYIKKNYKR